MSSPEVPVTYRIDCDPIDPGELDEACQLAYFGCSRDGALTEDPYEADVHNRPGVLIMACVNCLAEMAADI